MTIRLRRKLVFALGLSSALRLSSVLGLSSPAWAQSGTKAPAGSSKTVVQGSGTAKKEATVALSGYWFSSEDQLKMFVSNPAKYEVK